jgi:hypothetical protein
MDKIVVAYCGLTFGKSLFDLRGYLFGLFILFESIFIVWHCLE